MKKTTKKIFFSLILILQISFFLSAQNGEKQILIPHQVFVGDSATLSIQFSSKADLIKNPTVFSKIISVGSFERPLQDNEYSITSINLAKNPKMQGDQYSYTLTIQFIPWTTGSINFPPLYLDKDFRIIPSEINIDSIFSATKKDKKFSPPIGPILIPGTTYRILFNIIILLVAFILITLLLIKWQSFSLFCKNLKLRILYEKNKKAAIQGLDKLLSKNLSDKENACQIQTILRKYLDTRFSFQFSKYTSSEISKGFETLYQGLLSEAKENAAEDLTGIFIRTDFIRYSKNGEFEPNELNMLISKAKQIIYTFETPEAE